MEKNFEKAISDLVTFYNVQLNNLKLSSDNSVPLLQFTDNGKTMMGLRNLVSKISSPINAEQTAVQDEWVEYLQTHSVNSNTSQVLKDINDYLLDRTYFVGYECGPVDILIYYLLYNTFLNLTYHEKEKYLNASRWFNDIQHYKDAKLWRSIIQFSRCSLYA